MKGMKSKKPPRMKAAFCLVERQFDMEDNRLIAWERTVAQTAERPILERIAREMFREIGDPTHTWEVVDL
jgi:hypothetical protein